MGVDADVDAAWTSVPHPVLVVDRAGLLQGLSAAARSVLPGATLGGQLETSAPSWLSQAHDYFVRPGEESTATSGSVDGREFDAHPTRLPSGNVAWWLLEDTGRSLHVTRQA
jgi:hypothetical protein